MLTFVIIKNDDEDSMQFLKGKESPGGWKPDASREWWNITSELQH